MKPGSSSALCLLILMLATYIPKAQDKIYLRESTRQGKILSIDASVLKYKPTNASEKEQTIPTKNVLLLINESGSHLIPGQIAFNSADGTKNVDDFLSHKPGSYKYDRLFKMDGKVLEGDLVAEDSKIITFKTVDSTTKIKRSDVALFITRSGNHSITGSVDDALLVLSQVKPATQQPPTAPSTVVQTAQPVQNTAPAPPPTNIGEIVPGVTQAQFTEKAVQKTTQLSNYLKLLCDKKSRNNLALIVDQAVSLFVNEEVLVQVSSVNSPDIQQIAIRKYLDRLTLIAYDAVDIEWTKVQYIGSVKANPDGTYSGTVSFEQKFTGYLDGRVAYEDITRKEAQVILKTYVKNVEGQQTVNWEVLLSDVKVRSTKSTSLKS